MILIIKQTPEEGPGTIVEFFKDTKIIELSQGDSLPKDTDNLEAVFIMGGPMNVYEEEKYPFLREENIFTKLLIDKKVPLIGICLGAQLIAKTCEAKVHKVKVKEEGWYNVELTDDGLEDPLFKGIPKKLNVFQLHEDTFKLPEDSVLLAFGENCRHQAFRVGKWAYGLQFHIEVTPQMIKVWFGDKANKYKMLDENRYNRYARQIYKNLLHMMDERFAPSQAL